jgi:hypothetical protein
LYGVKTVAAGSLIREVEKCTVKVMGEVVVDAALGVMVAVRGASSKDTVALAALTIVVPYVSCTAAPGTEMKMESGEVAGTTVTV